MIKITHSAKEKIAAGELKNGDMIDLEISVSAVDARSAELFITGLKNGIAVFECGPVVVEPGGCLHFENFMPLEIELR